MRSVKQGKSSSSASPSRELFLLLALASFLTCCSHFLTFDVLHYVFLSHSLSTSFFADGIFMAE